MVQKYKWNIESEKMIEIIHFNINKILKENNKKIRLSELINKLNENTKEYKIHNNKKYNSVSKYIKYEFNGIKNYLDNCIDYGISTFKNDIYVHLLNEKTNYFNKRLTKDSDWILIN